MFSYPLQVHPCRASVVAVLKWRPARWAKSREATGSPSRAVPLLSAGVGHSGRHDVIGDVKFAAITTLIVVLSYLVAMTVSSLDTVLAYVGATGSTSISFILPGLFYFKISSPNSLHHQRLAKDDEDSPPATEGLFENDITIRKASRRAAILRWLALALAIYGVVVMATCLTTNTYFLIMH
jgi:amino acid permease